MSYIVHGQFNGVQKFILFLKSWRDSVFLIFSDSMSHSFAPRFETFSLPYLLDLIIHFSMQLFFLKSYEWSLNLKLPVIIYDRTPLVTLNISVNST